MEERGADEDHSRVQKWVVYYSLQLDGALQKKKETFGHILSMYPHCMISLCKYEVYQVPP